MRKSLLCILVLMLLLSSVALPVYAQMIDTDRNCSLTLFYSKEGVCFPELNIRIYRVAAFFSNGSYGLTGAFSNYPVKIHGITSQKEWREVANTLTAYAIADHISPDHTVQTDASGSAVFTDLQTGIYLIQGVAGENEKGNYQFENFLLFLPTPQSDGSQSYDVTAKPKGTFTPKPEEPEEVQYQVVKLWKDTGVQSQRPQSITVDILKNGVVQDTVVLNAGNNWSCSWKAREGEAIWTVVEKDVPAAYTVVITTSGTVFTITNSRPASGGTPPQTGDTFPLRQYVLVSSISGMLLMAMGIWRKRKYG